MDKIKWLMVVSALISGGCATLPSNSHPQNVTHKSSNKVYSVDECIGAIVNGRCHGSLLPKGGYHPTCHGRWLNGVCTGPMF